MIEFIAAIFLFLGSFFILVAAIGVVRFNDLYSRMHATTKATSFGLLLIIIGVSLFFSIAVVWLKALLVIIFIYLTAPLAAHSIAKSMEKNEQDEL